ncbi:MAG TPA: hypothetical protein VK604_25330 [Bryobacteraceae bacterium]|nr:hypothetical protein [Bryobacteraceae bacterium]
MKPSTVIQPGQLLALRDVADLSKIPRRNSARIVPEYFGAARAGLMDIHQNLQRGALTRAVWSKEPVDAALRYAHIHPVEHYGVPKSF